MGKVEKLVVLTVLFLTAVVIAFTLRKGDGDKIPAQSGPLDGAQKTVMDEVALVDSAADQAQDPQGSALRAGPGAAQNPPVLSADVDPAGSAVQGNPVQAGNLAPARALQVNGLVKNAEGLRSGLTADLMLYDWKAGDSWASVAQHVYGESRYESILRAANEGMHQPKPGDPILVPTTDMGKAPLSAVPTPAKVESGRQGAKSTTGKEGAATPVAPGSERVHEVKAGDSLSSISKQYYGTTTRWKEIAEANKGVLKDPNKLKVGMKLRIP